MTDMFEFEKQHTVLDLLHDLVLVVEMLIECSPGNRGLVQNVLNGNFFKGFLAQQGQQGGLDRTVSAQVLDIACHNDLRIFLLNALCWWYTKFI